MTDKGSGEGWSTLGEKINDIEVVDVSNKLVDEISKMIYDSHKDEVKETFYNESTIFSLDICVCKPQKKESLL